MELRAMTSRRDDSVEPLATLVDRLAAELLGASDAEVEAALNETGRARAAALNEVRALVRSGTCARGPDKIGLVAGNALSAAPTRGPTSRH